jgi:FkbM family methyltransferase
MMTSIIRRARVLLNDPDFRVHPVRALTRRIRWQCHWFLYPARPVVVANWHSGLSIELPNSAAAAQVFYRQYSSLANVQALMQFISAGMTVLDVGAHAGEYTLIAALLAGASGRVHAIEPQPVLVEQIRRNVARNALTNVDVHAIALGDYNGTANFSADALSLGGWVSASSGTSTVRCTTLDQFETDHRLQNVSFIKLDAAGNEAAVLAGGSRFLAAHRPTILAKLYSPGVTRMRFGHDISAKTLRVLEDMGYQLKVLLEGQSDLSGTGVSSADVQSLFARGSYCMHVLASTSHER